MKLKFIARIEKNKSTGFIAWIDNIQGLVVQAKTKDDAYKELLTLLKLKLKSDFELSFS